MARNSTDFGITPVYTFMPILSFRSWLENVADDPSAAESLATLIAQSGAVGVSLDRLKKVIRLSPESLDEVLKGLLASGQVVLLKVNGVRVYRATA